MNELLKYEITTTSYFLVSETKHGHRLKKCDKSSLPRELISIVPSQLQNCPVRHSDVEMVVVDFMALVRKLPVKKLNLKTYDDLASALKDHILYKAVASTRIDIIFDVYRRYSIKSGESAARSIPKSAITVLIKKICSKSTNRYGPVLGINGK